jgi:hypothetical protein
MARWTLPHEQPCYKLIYSNRQQLTLAKKFTVQRHMNRARGGRVIRRSKGAGHCDYFVTRVRIYRFCALLALKLLLARCYRWRAASTPSKLLACAVHVSPRAERKVHNVSQACDAQPDRINTSGDRRPRRTLCADSQRASRKLSVHAVAWCALCPPLYCPGAMRPRQACSQSPYLTLSGCVLLSQCGPGVRLARHRRRRQAL